MIFNDLNKVPASISHFTYQKMDNNPYLCNVVQTNGCRVWENPQAKEIQVPERQIEIFIKNIPKDLFEDDLLPHFERFGPIFQFRLLIDYENNNRGFAYLIYFCDKSALECLDVMGFFLVKPGVMLDVERSQERSHLLAMNIPSSLSDQEIKCGFLNLYSQLKNIVVVRANINEFAKSNCTAILQFSDHRHALNAKRWSGIGSINIWNRNIKILWATGEQVEKILTPGDEVKHVLFHNMPEDFDPEEFGSLMCTAVFPHEIISIRPMRSDWLVEFSKTGPAYVIFTLFNGKHVGDRVVFTEWVTYERLKTIDSFADFDFELRCLCLANYWDPPIFIYGRVIPFTHTQICAVIIKNNRKNDFSVFFVEMMYESLVEIHARLCEVLVLMITDIKDLPKRNLVIKCCNNFAIIGKLNHRA